MTIPRRRGKNNLNSMEHFASSYTRAQSFLSIDPVREVSHARSYLWNDGEDHDADEAIDDSESAIGYGPSISSPNEHDSLLSSSYNTRRSFSRRPSVVIGSPGTSHFQKNLSYTTPLPQGQHIIEEQALQNFNNEDDVIIVRKVEDEEGHVQTLIAGQSTAPQTIFNSVNVLIGVGLLSLSLGFKYSGWVLGTVMMIVSALATFYSARLLAKCLDTDHTLVTYADIGHAAFGSKARVMISLLFTLELTGACVSLFVLFADSLNALFPNVPAITFKWIGFLVLTPPCFLPLRILSFSSILGILCTTGVVLIVLFDGLYKTTGQPGSLWNPMETWLWPDDWRLVALSIGLFMAPWSGHAVFPNIYRDMRHPGKYTKCLVTTYQITFTVDMSMAVLGFVMYGNKVLDEVSKNVVITEGYPAFLSYLMTLFIGLIPIAKTPLNAQPIISMLDSTFNLTWAEETTTVKIGKALVRIFTVLMFVIMSILFPDFDKIMSLVGSLLCTTICLILPLAFYLKLYHGKIGLFETIMDWVMLVVFSALAIIGTYVSLTIQ